MPITVIVFNPPRERLPHSSAKPRWSRAQESAQYSAMAVELSDQDTVGTALTLQMALGFTVTVLAIFAIPVVEVRFPSLPCIRLWPNTLAIIFAYK